METESKTDDKSLGLSSIHDDALQYIISFLQGKYMARMESVCKRMKEINIEQVARFEFVKQHPFLEQSFFQAHQKYTSMISTSYKYAYHSVFCYPSVNEINEKFQQELKTKTDYSRMDHIYYMLEKMFAKGNIVLLVNASKLIKNYVLTNTANNVHLFCKHFVIYGSRHIPHNRQLYAEFNVNGYSKWFPMKTKLHLLKYHKNDLLIGNAYEYLIHCMMISCCELGLTDFAVEFRKMGAKIKFDTAEEIACKTFCNNIAFPYLLDYFWMDFKDPGNATAEELRKKLDARIAVFSVGKIKDEEKLHDLSIMTNNTYYTKQQMVGFLEQLLKLNAVGDEIMDSAQWFVEINNV